MTRTLSIAAARTAWCLAILASVTLTVPAAAVGTRTAGVDPITTLPAPSMGVTLGTWGVARSGPTLPGDTLAPQPPRPLRGGFGPAPAADNSTHPVALLPGVRNPLLNYSSSEAACVMAKRNREMGIVMTIVGGIAIPIGALGYKVGKDDMDADLAAKGAVLMVLGGICIPVGIVGLAAAAVKNEEHGCWGERAASVEETPPPTLVFDGFDEPADEPPAEEPPVEEPPAEEPADEVEPAEEPSSEEVPAEQPAEEAPSEEIPTEADAE